MPVKSAGGPQTSPTPGSKSVIPARKQLDGFISAYSPEVAATARKAFAALRKRLPAADVLVYDNYNALAIGFGPNERASDAIFSLALYPRWASLFFLQGADLNDPDGLLRGSGKRVRHIVLERTEILDGMPVLLLIEQALSKARVRLPKSGRGRLIIKSISAKQRPRRPPQAVAR
jgi:hypothetical protein